MAAINLDIGGNTRRLDRDIQKTVNKVYSINLKTKGDQPLGRITGKVNEFNKSLDASNARVIAFGASAGIIFGLERAFGALVRSTIEVQKSLQDINVILNVSSEQLQKFGSGLFNIARNTGQSFQEVAKAATEFSRQGLGVTETLKRTNEALILARLSGLDTAASVETLTAAVNSFADQAVTATEVVNKFATVDAAFAVSSADLADAISRVGSSAAQSGVSLNELIAIVTSAQQTTARGGAVIGNSFKTIFTRLQREKVVDLLESLGISTTDAGGQLKSTIQLLTDLGKVYDTLGSQQQAYVAEQVGGVFQINILKAALSDLGKEFSIYNSALKVSAGATDQALRRNEELNKSYAAQINALQENARQLAAAGGERLLGPSIDRLVGGTNAILGGINEEDGQGVGAQLGKGIVDGLGQFIAGPGLVLIGGVLLKLFSDLSKFATGSFQQLLGLNTAATQQKDLQQSITQILSKNPDLLKLALQGTEGLNAAANALLGNLKNQTVELQNQEKVAARIAKAFATQAGVRVAGGIPVVPTGKPGKAAGYIPNLAEESTARELGASSSVQAVPGIGKIGGQSFEANNQEFQLKNFAGTGETAVIPKYGNGIKEATKMISRGESGSILDKSARKKSRAGGFIPNSKAGEAALVPGFDTVENLGKTARKSGGLLPGLYNIGENNIFDQYKRPPIKRIPLSKKLDQYTKEAETYIKNVRDKALKYTDPVKQEKVIKTEFNKLRYQSIPISKFTNKVKTSSLLDPTKDSSNSSNIKGAMGEIDSQKRFGVRGRVAEKQGDYYGADFLIKKQGGSYLVESKITKDKVSDDVLIAKTLQYEGKVANGKYKKDQKNSIEDLKLKSIILSYAPGGKGKAAGYIPNFAAMNTLKVRDFKKGDISANYDKNSSVKGGVNARIIDAGLYAVNSSGVTQKGKGYGVAAYDAVLETVSSKGAWLTSDRNTVSPSAMGIWDFYRKKRPDVVSQLLPMKNWYLDPKFNNGQYEFPQNILDLKKSKNTWPPKTDPVWALQHKYRLKNPPKKVQKTRNLSSGFIPNFAQASSKNIIDVGDITNRPDILRGKIISLIYPEVSQGFQKAPATAIFNKQTYRGLVPVAGIEPKPARAALPDLKDSTAKFLTNEANNFGQILGATNFLKPNELPNRGAVDGAAGNAFEGAVMTLFKNNVKGRAQNAGIDFTNPSAKVRKIFNNAPGQYDAKINAGLVNEVFSKLLTQAKPGIITQRSGALGKEYQRQRDAAVEQLNKEGITGAVARKKALRERFGIFASGYIPNFANIGAIQNLISRGATEGERQAAITALDRVKNSVLTKLGPTEKLIKFRELLYGSKSNAGFNLDAIKIKDLGYKPLVVGAKGLGLTSKDLEMLASNPMGVAQLKNFNPKINNRSKFFSKGYVPNFALDLTKSESYTNKQRERSYGAKTYRKASGVIGSLFKTLPDKFFSNGLLGDAGQGIETNGILNAIRNNALFAASFAGPKAINFVTGAEKYGLKVSENLKKQLASLTAKGVVKTNKLIKGKGFAGGYIPNFAAIQDAINRERSAGVPSSQIYVAQEKALTSANPMGLGVFNKKDEPTKKSRKDAMQRKGFASGFVPNFAAEDSQGAGLGTSIATLTGQLSGLAFAFAFNSGAIKTSLQEISSANKKAAQQARQELNQRRNAAQKLTQADLKRVEEIKKTSAATSKAALDQIRKEKRAAFNQSSIKERRQIANMNRTGNFFGGGRGLAGGKLAGFTSANAFGLSFAAPIIGETIKNLAGTETKERRVTGAVGAGLGQVGSFAGIGALIGKGKGAAIGTAIGAILAIPEVVNQLVSDVPELTKAAQKASESLTKFSEAGQRYFTSLEKLNSAIDEDGGRNEKLISQARNEYVQALSDLSVADQKALTQAEKLGNAQEVYAELLEKKIAEDKGAQAALAVETVVTDNITGESLKRILGGAPRLVAKAGDAFSSTIRGALGMEQNDFFKNVIEAYTPKTAFDPASANAKILEQSFLDLALAGTNGAKQIEKIDQVLKAIGDVNNIQTADDLKAALTNALGDSFGSRKLIEGLTKSATRGLTDEASRKKAVQEITSILVGGAQEQRKKTESAVQSEATGEKDRTKRIELLKQEKSAMEATIKAIQTSIASTNIFTSALEQFAESARSFDEGLRISQEFTAPKEFLSDIFAETPGVKGPSSLEKTLELSGGFAEIQNELTGTINTIFSEFKTSIRDNIQTPFDEAFAKISENLSATTFEGVATGNIQTKGVEERTKAFDEQKKLNSTMSSVETLMQQFINGQIDDKEFQQKSIAALQAVGIQTGESKKIGSDIQLAVAQSGAKLLAAAQAAQQRRKQLATEAVQKTIQEKIGQALGVFGGFKGFLERPDQKSPLQQITPVIDKISEIRDRGEFRYNNRASIREQGKMAPELGRGFIQLYQTLNEFSGGAFRGILQKRVESGVTAPTRGRGGYKGETGGFGDIVRGIRIDLENTIKEFEARIKTESRPGGDKVLARDLQDFVKSIKILGIENVAQLQAASATGTGTQAKLQQIFKEYGADSLKALEKLPGIGPEIAKAVAENTGFTQDNPLLNEAQLQSSYQVQMIGFLAGIQDAIIKTGVGDAKNIKPYMVPEPTNQNAQNNQETPITNRQQNAVQAARQTAPLEKSIVSQVTALSQNTTAISNLTGAIASLKSSIDQPQVNNQTVPQNNTPTITSQTSAPVSVIVQANTPASDIANAVGEAVQRSIPTIVEKVRLAMGEKIPPSFEKPIRMTLT